MGDTDRLAQALLPCPFCGGAVDWCSIPEDPHHECHQIECKTCGLVDLIGSNNPDTIEEMRAICAERFNNRAALASLAPATVEGDAETEFEAFLKTLPLGAQKNVREAMDRSESVTFDAFKFRRELAAAHVARKDAERLRYCIERGRFPVKNVQKLPFPKLLGWTWDDLRPDPVYYPTADAAIDSAIAAGNGEDV